MDSKSSRENIYKRRKELGLSQGSVADEMNISLNAYVKIEDGPTRIFSPRLIDLAAVLKTTPEALLLGDLVTLEKYNEMCDSLKQYYNTREAELNDVIKQKDLFIQRLNEMVTAKDGIISNLESKISQLSVEIELLKKE